MDHDYCKPISTSRVSEEASNYGNKLAQEMVRIMYRYFVEQHDGRSPLQMPRCYKQKEGAKPRIKIDEDKMKRAVQEALKGESGIQTIAKKYGVDRMSLKRYKAKYETNPNSPMTSDYKNKLIFSREREEELAEYLKMCAKINHGLTLRKIRELAYEIAVRNNIPRPEKWNVNNIAGIDWVQGFMSRNGSLSLRTPEATSLSRATSFNEKNVGYFFENLKNILDREKFTEHDVWNVDETGCTTVQKPKKIVAAKGQKQVGQVTSAERGQLVTVCSAISAAGRSIPPFFVFPRVNFKPSMLTGAPEKSFGAANLSGWMSADTFYLYLCHFTNHVKVSKERKVLLTLDNHDSHISIKSLDFCKENGIILLTLPPHCSHKIQPLDVCVFGPFKNSYDRNANEWMSKNPGRVITIYDISCIVGKAYPVAFTVANIRNGFLKTGIQPYNPSIFKKEDFLSSFVSDRPEEQTVQDQCQNIASTSSTTNIQDETLDVQPARPSAPLCLSRSSNFSVAPEQVLPFPKAGPRKVNRKGRKKLKSSILTDTPIKRDIEEQIKIREEKKKVKIENSNKKLIKKLTKVEKVKRKVLASSSSSSDDSEISFRESDDSVNEFVEDFEELTPTNTDNLQVGKFVLVIFKGGQRLSSLYKYLCVVNSVDHDDGEYRVTSLKCTNNSKKLFSMVETDNSDVKFEEIIGIAPDPNITLKGERVYYTFQKPIDVFEKA